ncbi:MAG: hypothetical protein K2F66_07920, partial [Duncaniella sp.]|nr:hypothetical protein [Duncaniella sp.]
LLLSAAQQVYLYRLLGLPVPVYAHVPLICNSEGRRLSKRDQSLNMEYMRGHFSSREIIGMLAHMAGIIPEPSPCTPRELIDIFDWAKVPRTPNYLITSL